MDGCLVDSREGILESFTAAVREVLPNRAFDPASVRVGPPIREMCRRTFPDLPEADLQKLVLGYRAHYDTTGLEKTTLFPGGRELLEQCVARGLEVDIATNKPMRAAGGIISRLDLGGFLRSVITVDAVSPPFAGKLQLLQYVCQINHVDFSTALYVGDTEEDLLAARTCGLQFVFAAFGYGQADYPLRVNSLSELAQLLREN